MTIEELLQALNRQNFGPDDSTIASSARHPVKAVKKFGTYISDLMNTGMGQSYSDDAFTYAPLDRSRLGAANEIAGYAQVGSMPFAPKTKGGTLGTAALPDTEFSNAHKIAQKNAALPIEQGGLGLAPDNTAMDRAKALGFDAPMFHFSRHGVDVSELDSGKFAVAPFDAIGTHFGNKNAIMDRFSDTTKYLSRDKFNELKGSNYPVMIKRGKEFKSNNMPWDEYDLNTELRNIGGFNDPSKRMTYQEMNKELREKLFSDFDSIPYINDVEAKGSISYIVPPNNIRSIFAAFDPMKKNSSNILASTLMGMLMAREQEQK